jgi:hypothetical protein
MRDLAAEMQFRPIARESGAFQRPVTPGQVKAMCRRAFGAGVRVAGVAEVVELGGGLYNNTFRVDLDPEGPVVLWVAPDRAASDQGHQGPRLAGRRPGHGF